MSYFRSACVEVLLIAFALVAIAPVAIAQTDTDPFSGQPAAGAAGMRSPDIPSGENVQGPSAANGRITFRSQTRVVEVPAVVTDKSGHVLHGLTKDDFRIYEDGKKRNIASFDEVTARAGGPTAQPAPAGQFSNISERIREPQSVIIIILDSINTPFLDQAYARRQVLNFLARKTSPHQTLGLVAIGANGVQVLCPLGTDPATLAAALQKASGQISPMEPYGTEGKMIAAADPNANELWATGSGRDQDPSEKMANWIAAADAVEGRNQQARSIEATLKAFLSLAWSLSGVPGRKSLVWLTGSFPFPLESESSLPGMWADLYEKTMQALNNAQVSIYPVDARGLMGTSGFAGNETLRVAVMETAPPGDHLNDSIQSSMRLFADMTGGRAFYNNNDLAGAIASAGEDSASYYLLSYYVDTSNTSSGWRKLRVEVKHPDVVVRARSGFLETGLTADPELTHKADVQLALGLPFDTTAIPVTARWLGITEQGGKTKIGFSLNMPESSLVDESQKNLFDMDLIVQLSKDGVPSTVAQKTLKGEIPAQALPEIKFEGIIYNNFITVPRGKYDVRFLVRDNLTGKIGTVSTPLTVN